METPSHSLWPQWLSSNSSQILIGLVCLLLAIFIFDRVIKIVLRKILQKVSHRDETLVHIFLRDDKLVFWILSLPYLTILNLGAKWIPDLPDSIVLLIDRSVLALYVIFGFFIISSCLRIINTIYNKSPLSRTRPIKGYLQGIQILAFFASFILVLSILLDRSPIIFISGLGAMTAILMLVFKDTILSFVAGVQLTTNGHLRVGDWIEMPQFGADGDVIEIALNSVTIQNWDKTFTIIPAHKFLENSFKNWRGMQESGGRRIKRSLSVDLNTVKFLSSDDLQRLGQIQVLKQYMNEKALELEQFNKNLGQTDLSEGLNNVNLRKLTNLGTFRAYIIAYLKNHPLIHKNLTFLVRQLAPGPEGLPLEIYVFTTDTAWSAYESIQADIFDHLYAVIGEFGLRPFQNPSGRDIHMVVSKSLP
ncbi:MAG: mechanosensitive ion channel family protein [Bdellovibrionaceae bacterium]|nr:mechanosensitive ion channel family protein [Pseudobdellovibrionaceae bacterium]